MNATTDLFERDVISRSHRLPVVVDFCAAWCGPCHALGPAIESEVAQRTESIELVEIDVDSEPELAARFGIQSIPTVVVFVGGRAITGFAGAQPPAAIGRFLDGVIHGNARLVEES